MLEINFNIDIKKILGNIKRMKSQNQPDVLTYFK